MTLTQKGLNTLLQCNLQRGDVTLSQYLETGPDCVRVHVACERDYTNPKRMSSLAADASQLRQESPAKKLRSACSFNWKADCFFCGTPAVVGSRHPDRADHVVVCTLPLRSRILEICDKHNDHWSAQVRSRLENCIDLVSVEAVYHQSLRHEVFLRQASGRP